MQLTKTPCSERIRRLEKSGVVDGYHARVDAELVGVNHVTVVHVNLSSSAEQVMREFNRGVAAIAEVQTCVMIAGAFDYILTVRTRDVEHFRRVLGEQIGALLGVFQTSSNVVIETVKEQTFIKLSES